MTRYNLKSNRRRMNLQSTSKEEGLLLLREEQLLLREVPMKTTLQKLSSPKARWQLREHNLPSQQSRRSQSSRIMLSESKWKKRKILVMMKEKRETRERIRKRRHRGQSFRRHLKISRWNTREIKMGCRKMRSSRNRLRNRK